MRPASELSNSSLLPNGLVVPIETNQILAMLQQVAQNLAETKSNKLYQCRAPKRQQSSCSRTRFKLQVQNKCKLNAAIKMQPKYLPLPIVACLALVVFLHCALRTSSGLEHKQQRQGVQQFEACKTQTFVGQQIVDLSQLVFEPSATLCSSWSEMSATSNSNTTDNAAWLHIERLILSKNNLTSLQNSSGLERIANLLELRIDRNQLGQCDEASLAGLIELRQLDLSHNLLTQLPAGLFASLGKLEQLDLSFNRLALIGATFRPLIRLQIFSIHHNSLDQLPEQLEQTGSLISLDISHNKISELTNVTRKRLANCNQLARLNLDSNLLLEVPRNALGELRALNTLQLTNNPIRYLHQQAFEKLANLRELSVPTLQQNSTQAATQASATSAQTKTQSAPSILRPSIEEVASKLSRKYLNLEQHKQMETSSTATSSFVLLQNLAAAQKSETSAAQAFASDAEQEITLVPPSAGLQRWPQTSASGELHYIGIDETSSQSLSSSGAEREAATQQKGASASAPKSESSRAARKKKVSASLLANLQLEPSDDLVHCQRYLQLHQSSRSPPAGGGGGHLSTPLTFEQLSGVIVPSSASSQPLPCSCAPDLHFAREEQDSAIWLNCDHLQLVSGAQFQSANANSNWNQSQAGNFLQELTRFSQRNSALQVLFAQKFHHLQLFHLKSIDLSQNRLREIQIDAFHGLENSLEHLNLAQNLLGDLRTVLTTSSRSESKGFVFHNDELNRLAKLKWLSLRDNQISQLSENIFAKSSAERTEGQQKKFATTSEKQSELVYLDLSENLLSFIPSNSIERLSKLEVLNLSKNRINQLDQFSKFPHSLKQLDLSQNSMTTIRQCDLIDLENLIEINLSHNLLSQMDMLAFVPSSSSYLAAAAAAAIPAPGPHFPGEAPGLEDSTQASGLTRRKRKSQEHEEEELKVEGEEEPLEALESSVEFNQGELEDLEAQESLLSALKSQFEVGKSERTIGAKDEASERNIRRHFNSTLRLNLSHNLFEHVPGDSLLKFSRLQVLDLSYNRIRTLDANYLCSIYNFVDSLRQLDLSGNLLLLDNTSAGTAGKADTPLQLNRLLGCLQRLETLTLSTNRLGLMAGEQKRPPRGEQLFEMNSHELVVGSEDPIEAEGSEPQKSQSGGSLEGEMQWRLCLKFGDTFGSKHLRSLDLSDNQLRLFPVIEQVAARPPPANVNQTLLDEWMLSSRARLEELNLSFNQIERLEEQDFEHLFQLRQLNLDSNKIAQLPGKLMARFTLLERVSVAGNRLTELDALNELFERSIRSLRSLNLANNRLTRWPDIRKLFPAQEAHSGGDKRETTMVASASLEAPAETSKTEQTTARQHNAIEFALEQLNLESNLLTSANVSALFEQLTYMRSLRRLNLNFNLLNKIRSEWFKFANKNLQHLQLSGNKINSIDLGAFALNQVNELVRLDLDFNLLKELKRKTFDSMPRINHLDLGNNLIHTISSEAFHQLKSLQVLKLNKNKLTSWKCEYFSNLCNSISGNINVDLATLITGQAAPHSSTFSSLIELDLSHNSLSQLRANSIAVHTRLVRLNLAHNKLSFIPHDLFKATTLVASNGGQQVHLVSSLKWLNLEHNRIQTIDNINFKPLRNLVALDLSHNELQNLGVDVVGAAAPAFEQAQQHRQMPANNSSQQVDSNDSHESVGALNLEPQKLSGKLVLPAEASFASTSQADNADTSAFFWPSLCKLRHLNLAHNSLTQINQSMLADLSPFVALKLNLSHNLLESAGLPVSFFTKMSSAAGKQQQAAATISKTAGFELVFTLKIESIDLSHNRLAEYPSSLLDNHHSSLEACNLSHNRIQTLPQNSNSMIHIKWLNFDFNPLSRESNELLLFEPRSARSLNLAATRLYAIQVASIDTPLGHYYSSSGDTKLRMAKMSSLMNQTLHLDLIRSISKPIDAPYLRHLNLSSNQIVWLAANVFDKLSSLQTLDLSHNQLTRLHLLNGQLAHLSGSLEHLNLGSNLFTTIDQSDFAQLTNIKRLDLSNLLSLQKLNCKFLLKLVALKSLRLFNYPQLRHQLQALVGALGSDSLAISDRLRQKIQAELVMSTVGGHCLREAANGKLTGKPENKWLQLEELELELLNDFEALSLATSDSLVSRLGGFRLNDQLRQLLGPKLRVLTLTGLNLTSLSEHSLLGVTGAQLELKISYTSLAQLPLGQIMGSVAKRTQVRLDLRHNNIQSIDMNALQWLDELQQISQATTRSLVSHDGATDSSRGAQFSSPMLQLAANPFRCDCHMRPVWLWLNQRWARAETPPSSDELLAASAAEEAGETSPQSSERANYWLKFHSLSQTSDLRCFYPLKLRGKLAQHVYYNDLVCKSPPLASGPVARQASQRKRNNDTSVRSSDSYYLTSLGGHSGDELDHLGDYSSDYYNEDSLAAIDSQWSVGGVSSTLEPPVRITRFNRYPSAINNSTSVYFTSNFSPALHPSEPDSTRGGSDDLGDHEEPGSLSNSNRLGKRDEHSLQAANREASLMKQFNKHRPNTGQKHQPSGAMDGLRAASSIGAGQSGLLQSRGSGAGGPSASSKHSMLTEFDVMVLTVASIAMTAMAFVIMSICLLRQRWNRRPEDEQIHSRLVLSRALFSSTTSNANISARSNKMGSFESSGSSAKGSPRLNSKRAANTGSTGQMLEQQQQSGNFECPARTKLKLVAPGPPFKLQATPASSSSGLHQQPVFIPIHTFAPPPPPPPPPSSSVAAAHSSGHQNFLMRSPTIRRMHGLASNALSKCALRAYPPTANGTKRRRLFLRNNLAATAVSQLTTAKMAAHIYQQQERQLLDSVTLDNSLLSGCPMHAFDALFHNEQQETTAQLAASRSNGQKCLFCENLLLALQRQQQRAKALGEADGQRRPTRAAMLAAEAASRRVKADGGRHQLEAPTFMSPSIIQELVRQLDERHEANTNKVHSQSFVERKSATAQSKSLGTFGQAQERDSNNNKTGHHYAPRNETGSSIVSSSSSSRPSVVHKQTKLAVSRKAIDQQISSQIPGLDVEGVFCYQTDSQSESQQAHCRRPVDGAVTPASTVATGHEDIFILVRDTPTRLSANFEQQNLQQQQQQAAKAMVSASITSAKVGSPSRRAGAAATRDSIDHQLGADKSSQTSSMAMVLDVSSIAMQDECSRSSSPIAYGFMRSSPSATTLSSNTMTAAAVQQQQQQQHQQNQYIVNRSPDHSTGHSRFTFRGKRSSFLASEPAGMAAKQQQQLVDGNNNNSSSNNNNELAIIDRNNNNKTSKHSGQLAQIVGRENQPEIGVADEQQQVVVSRL